MPKSEPPECEISGSGANCCGDFLIADHETRSLQPRHSSRYPRPLRVHSSRCMPVISSQFDPPWPLRSGHLQTILPAILGWRTSVAYERERLELADGDFLDLDWLPSASDRLAILSHGLEGSSRDVVMRRMAAALHRSGWNVLAWNYRGCSEEMNRLPRLYHSGETTDLARVVEHAAERFPFWRWSDSAWAEISC